MHTCETCHEPFEISEQDARFYEKVAPVINGEKFVPSAPQSCPRCRMQLRFSFRNESSLHLRNCDKTGVQMLAMYPAEAPFPVYSPEIWFGDGWDARSYGRDFDFNRPFFDQFLELRNAVPHLSLISSNNENCDYCNIVGSCKNCYLCFGSIESENCYYGNPFRCRDCCDCLLPRNSELCLECTDCNRLYNSYRCQNCSDSQDLLYCLEVRNSHHCFASIGLNRKEYHILNKPYTKEQYFDFLSKVDFTNEAWVKDIEKQFNELKLSLPHRYYVGTNNENISGNYIFDSKDCHEVFNSEKCQDLKYAYQMLAAKDCMDVSNGEYGELNLEILAFFNNVNNCTFSYFLWDGVYDVHYSAHCTQNVQHCFGSMGLKHAAYCILNKQYTKEEYEALVPRIIEHMKKTGEWGKFFPAAITPFRYNETVASQLFPLSESEAKQKGWGWFNEPAPHFAEEKNLVRVCEVTKKPFKLIPQELPFYERFKAPLPKRSPKQRHLDRLALRNPQRLWKRPCSNCSVELESTYSPDRPERVYCEACYLKTIY